MFSLSLIKREQAIFHQIHKPQNFNIQVYPEFQFLLLFPCTICNAYGLIYLFVFLTNSHTLYNSFYKSSCKSFCIIDRVMQAIMACKLDINDADRIHPTCLHRKVTVMSIDVSTNALLK